MNFRNRIAEAFGRRTGTKPRATSDELLDALASTETGAKLLDEAVASTNTRAAEQRRELLAALRRAESVRSEQSVAHVRALTRRVLERDALRAKLRDVEDAIYATGREHDSAADEFVRESRALRRQIQALAPVQIEEARRRIACAADDLARRAVFGRECDESMRSELDAIHAARTSAGVALEAIVFEPLSIAQIDQRIAEIEAAFDEEARRAAASVGVARTTAAAGPKRAPPFGMERSPSRG